jgi:hypothetical protein
MVCLYKASLITIDWYDCLHEVADDGAASALAIGSPPRPWRSSCAARWRAHPAELRTHRFGGQRASQSWRGSIPTSSSKISAHFATHTWQMISPASFSTTRTSRLWRPQKEQTTSRRKRVHCHGTIVWAQADTAPTPPPRGSTGLEPARGVPRCAVHEKRKARRSGPTVPAVLMPYFWMYALIGGTTPWSCVRARTSGEGDAIMDWMAATSATSAVTAMVLLPSAAT